MENYRGVKLGEDKGQENHKYTMSQTVGVLCRPVNNISTLCSFFTHVSSIPIAAAAAASIFSSVRLVFHYGHGRRNAASLVERSLTSTILYFLICASIAQVLIKTCQN